MDIITVERNTSMRAQNPSGRAQSGVTDSPAPFFHVISKRVGGRGQGAASPRGIKSKEAATTCAAVVKSR